LINRIIRRVRKDIQIAYNRQRAKSLDIGFSKPNYIYKQRFNEDTVVVDVGCADDPDFSLFMMSTFNVKAYAVDPTRKHFDALKKVESSHEGQFKHLPLAVANESGTLTFHESRNNASGSLLSNHTNITNDETVSYEVEAVTVPELLKRIGAEKIDFLKLDLEGIEYHLLKSASSDDFQCVDQLFVEFHHHCIPEFSKSDTKRLADRVKGFGFQCFSLDSHNFLFYRE